MQAIRSLEPKPRKKAEMSTVLSARETSPVGPALDHTAYVHVPDAVRKAAREPRDVKAAQAGMSNVKGQSDLGQPLEHKGELLLGSAQLVGLLVHVLHAKERTPRSNSPGAAIDHAAD